MRRGILLGEKVLLDRLYRTGYNVRGRTSKVDQEFGVVLVLRPSLSLINILIDPRFWPNT